MTVLSSDLAECVEKIYSTLDRIERELDESRRQHATFEVQLASALERYEDVRKR